ncbi:MAG: hypothetical protein ABIP61_15155, partial [Burkholderiaceae bacterium]
PLENDFVIDWHGGPVASRVDSTAPSDARPEEWVNRFVNHLGASDSAINPNAGLKLQLPVSAELAPHVSSLQR